ncbi:MAG: class I SAM-dependent methyltransferase [Oscillatoriales cyanobacterium SM2_2_1]|nr:class I SAM-dependent methyltransferase [Oscillatoriales cyanobacterium SM2_2_1]
MATLLRQWSYQYQWLYDTVSTLAALSVGGEARLRQLYRRDLAIAPHWQVLDLCCGAGPLTQELLRTFSCVTGLDASPYALQRAQKRAPSAHYVQGFAEAMPLANNQFDLVVTSTAMHEMTPNQLQQIFAEVHRVLKPGGQFVILDFHRPTNLLFWPAVALFLWLFETETAWQLLSTDLTSILTCHGFTAPHQRLYAGGSLQVLQTTKQP